MSTFFDDEFKEQRECSGFHRALDDVGKKSAKTLEMLRELLNL